MERPVVTAIKPNKRKVPAAAIIAAAVAALWILFELALFCISIPTAPEMAGVDYCTYETENGVYVIRDNVSIRFSEDCGEIDSVSFLAQVLSGEENYNGGFLTVKVRAYDPARSDTLVTYRTQKFAVGEGKAKETVLRVDVPEAAGDVILEFSYDGYDYCVGEISFNSPSSASFNFIRCGIVLAVIAVCFVCSYFGLWRTFFDPTKKSHRVFGIAVCLVCVSLAFLLSAFLNYGKAPVEYPLIWDPVYYNPYEQQFDALMKGQLHLDVTPSDELLALENPYDPANRTGVSYSWDRAFYNGRYYSYFGMAPIFTVYFPYYFLTGDMPAENTVTTVFALLTALFFSLAAVKWASMYTKKLPLPLLLIGTLGALFSSQVFLIMRGRAKFYYIATIAGMAFLSLFVWLLLCGISGTVRLSQKEDETPRKWKKLLLYALAGVAYGLLFMSRVNMALLAAFIVLPFLWFKVVTEKPEACSGKKLRFRRLSDIAAELFALGVPVVAFAALQLVLNYLRFDSFFEFGTTYQLTVSDVSLNKIRLSDLPYTIFHYFLQPVTIGSDFPFVSLYAVKLESYGHYVYVDTGMGLFAIPMMWMLAGSVLIFANKKRSAAYKVTLGSLLLGMIAVALFDFCLGGVIFRYTCDLTLLAAFAAMAVMFSVCEDMEGARGDTGACVASGKVLSAFSAVALLVCLSLCMSLNNNLTAYSTEAYLIFKSLFVFF